MNEPNDKIRFAMLTEAHLRWPAWRGLSDGARLVYLALLLHADRRTGECNPEHAALVDLTGLKRRAVIYNVRQLEQRGMIDYAPGRGRGNRSRYRLLPPPKGAPIVMSFSEGKGAPIVMSFSEGKGAPIVMSFSAPDAEEKVHGDDEKRCTATTEKVHGDDRKGARPDLPSRTYQNIVGTDQGTDPDAAAPLGACGPAAAGADAPSTAGAERVPAGTPAAEPPAAEPPPAATQAKAAAQRRKGQRLTEADRAAARSSFGSMAGFLGYGPAGAHAPPERWRDLEPYDRNWFHAQVGQEEFDPGEIADNASEYQVAAWAWFMLNALLAAKGLDLVLPGPGADLLPHGRDRGVLGDLPKTRGLAWCVKHVRTVCERFEDIREAIAAWSTPPAIDPGLFRDPRVVKESAAVIQGTVVPQPQEAA